MIAIPEEYRNLESQHLEVVALVANNGFVPKMQKKGSDIYKALEQLNADMSDNDYLTFKFKNLSKTHLYVITEIDDELLYEARKEKHG
jgi:hypothetical protein